MPTATFRRYQYRRYLPHYQKDDRPLFVTFRTRKPLKLSAEAQTLALQHCLHDHGVTITLHAAVIMPDHVHLLFTALRDARGWTFVLPEILRAIQRCFGQKHQQLARKTRLSLAGRILRPYVAWK
jgi:REP element-mobilizing transposase RayT